MPIAFVTVFLLVVNPSSSSSSTLLLNKLTGGLAYGTGMGRLVGGLGSEGRPSPPAFLGWITSSSSSSSALETTESKRLDLRGGAYTGGAIGF